MTRYVRITIRYLEPERVEVFKQKNMGDFFLLRYDGPMAVVTDKYGSEKHIPTCLVGNIEAEPEPRASW